MKTPSLESQIKAVHYDLDNQRAFNPSYASKKGYIVTGDETKHLRRSQLELVSVLAREALSKLVMGPVNARAWAAEGRVLFKYMHYRYRQCRLHENVLLLSDRHEQTRKNQVDLFMDAQDFDASQIEVHRAYEEELSLGEIQSGPEL